MFILIAALVLTFLYVSPAPATECVRKACIEVYTQNGHIVIEGRRGKGESSTATLIHPSTPKPKITPRPQVSKKPVVRASAPPVAKKPRKPREKKSSSAATSLQDKLIESIPTAGISYQPSFSPLVQVPVYFWSDIPTLVTKKVEILGEVISLRLRPTFFWHYGDGTVYATRKAGAAFPDGQIRHTYKEPGHYLIELITHWDGEFTLDGVTSVIPGEITTVSVLPITIASAPIRFVN
jgi:hypothetical protein